MTQAYGSSLWVIEEDGQAVCETQHQVHTAGASDQGIRRGQDVPVVAGIHHSYAVAVDLSGRDHLFAAESQSLVDNAVIRFHSIQVVTY
jgi:hypothetical protein